MSNHPSVPGEDPPADDHDPVLVLALYLAQANSALAFAHVEHDAVLKRLGTRAPPPTTLPRQIPRPVAGSGAYRGKDELAELQRAVDEARLAVRTLRGLTSALASECDMEFARPPIGASIPGLVGIALLVLGGIGGFIWLLIDFGGDPAFGLLFVACFFAAFYFVLFAPKKKGEE